MIVLSLFSFVAVSVIATWGRSGLSRSERRAMRSYEHGLQVLGEVTRRGDLAGRTPPPATPAEAPEPPPGEPVAESPPRVAVGEQSKLVFADDSDAFERAREESDDGLAASASSWGGEPALPPSLRTRPGWTRRRSLGIVLVVAIIGLAAGGYAVSRRQPSTRSTTAQTTPRRHPHRPSTRRHSTSTTTPSILIPVSTSPTVVAFVVPRGSYTISLSDTGGQCWVGIMRAAGGPYVWQDMLASGESTSYTASGPVVVRIGAPKYLRVKVNGVPARLPGFVQPYDVTFSSSDEASAA